MIPVTPEEAGGLCSKPQATPSCTLIKILPQKDNETSICTVQTQQWMRKSESPTIVEDRQQIRSQHITAAGCVRENRAERSEGDEKGFAVLHEAVRGLKVRQICSSKAPAATQCGFWGPTPIHLVTAEKDWSLGTTGILRKGVTFCRVLSATVIQPRLEVFGVH